MNEIGLIFGMALIVILPILMLLASGLIVFGPSLVIHKILGRAGADRHINAVVTILLSIAIGWAFASGLIFPQVRNIAFPGLAIRDLCDKSRENAQNPICPNAPIKSYYPDPRSVRQQSK